MAACVPDLEGRTLFHYAAATGKTHVSKYFMEQVKVDDVNMKDAGADPNIRKHGVTPLESAASEGFTEFFKCLLNAGADPNVTSFYGLTPIEIAALQCNYQGVMILFPVISRILAIPDWRTGGIMKYIHSEELHSRYLIELAIMRMNRKLKEKFLTLKSKGEDAFKREGYLGAICWYTEAINAEPSDATVLSNRSLCWDLLNEGSRALPDAEFILLKIDISLSDDECHFTMLLDFVKSAYSFNKALELDPKNEELQKAFWSQIMLGRSCCYAPKASNDVVAIVNEYDVM
ncbi:uncharacterized protein LOC126708333 [Quercus robur]|uniref:uncharacterized protein LOC126708333 n=1 Tax=Quercus robur TaxID=38942 RepID=UPI0021615B16|nr:uncharacterized protein LOC126708333 [Quercus robur]